PESLIEDLAAALRVVRQAARQLPPGRLRDAAATEEAEAESALWRAAGMELDVVASDEALVPGQSFSLELRLWNGGETGIDVKAVRPLLPVGWNAEPLSEVPARLGPGELAEVE